MKNTLFSGVSTALVTPYLDGKINYPMLEQLLRRQMEAGIRSVVLCGTTGEAPTLSDEEKLELFRVAKSYVGDSMQIIAGTGSNSTEHAVWLSKEAEKFGVDGLLIVSPYYNKANEDGLIAHYLSVAHAVKLPVIVYNVPGRTGVDIPIRVYKALSRIPNIIGVKEASTSIVKIAKIVAECGNDLPVWAGNDDMAVPVISIGGKGVISVLSNVAPVETRMMVDAALDGDFDTAGAMHCSLLELIELLFSEVNPIPVKAAMKMIGFDCGSCRLPLTGLSKDNFAKMKDYFGQ